MALIKNFPGAIFIAFDTLWNKPVFLRMFTKNRLDDPHYCFETESVNALLGAKNAEALTAAVQEFYPLSLYTEKSICSCSEFQKLYSERFIPITEEHLIEVFTNIEWGAGKVNMSSLKRAIKKYSAFVDSDYLECINASRYQDNLLTIEPIEDWLYIREQIGTILALKCHIIPAKIRNALSNYSLNDEQISSLWMGSLLDFWATRETADGNSLGWKFDYGSGDYQNSFPGVVFYSQAARLIYGARYSNSDSYSSICLNCQTPMINYTGRKPKKFCKESCKQTYYNRRDNDGK